MIEIRTRTLVLACLACMAVGWWYSRPAPAPAPLEDRPVLRWIAKAAKTFLWIAIFVEPPPPQTDRHYAVKTEVGEDGYPRVEHARGW